METINNTNSNINIDNELNNLKLNLDNISTLVSSLEKINLNSEITK